MGRYMVFQKILAAAIAILIVWVMVPHVKRGEFIAPNPLPANTWMSEYVESNYHQTLATPPEGYGFRRFDFWNEAPLSGRPAEKDDFDLHY